MDCNVQDVTVSHVCHGVIKKLFPAKRYGFVVCECIEHRGEAHFNYSELAPNVSQYLCVGWRLYFTVTPQERTTPFCSYRAEKVRPVSVMVVQCQLDAVEDKTGRMTCRELGDKQIFIEKKHFNGSFDLQKDQINLCRATVTWQSLKTQRPYAIHCSQETGSCRQSPTKNRFSSRHFGDISSDTTILSSRDMTSNASFSTRSEDPNYAVTSTPFRASRNFSFPKSMTSTPGDPTSSPRTQLFNEEELFREPQSFRQPDTPVLWNPADQDSENLAASYDFGYYSPSSPADIENRTRDIFSMKRFLF